MCGSEPKLLTAEEERFSTGDHELDWACGDKSQVPPSELYCPPSKVRHDKVDEWLMFSSGCSMIETMQNK
ncbi:hypothetical protein EVAR_50521_1 [Eumeta japonica]|uniref:Uncharacterized protein n=1 Tax=Eumeta variegata TaxID=151549 RepID=A0A4C1X945_EUMVA|nr:hypothetical protein EVAR_50521_1 [Eumeta japonica]